MNYSTTYLSFVLNGRYFAVDTAHVLEVLYNHRLNPIPIAIEFVAGVINFRGEIVTIIDLQRKFMVPDDQTDKKNAIIVLEFKTANKTLYTGCLVSKVNRVVTVPTVDIQPVPQFGTYFNPDYLSGVINLDHQFCPIINMESIFSS